MAGCRPRLEYVATDPAAGRCLASSATDSAVNRQATRATMTASGSAPPAKAAPDGMDAAIAAPGAIAVMLWNSTSRSPMAPRRSPGWFLPAVFSTVWFWTGGVIGHSPAKWFSAQTIER